MPASILLLSPSQGLGGGIERYLATVETALHQRGVRCLRLDLLTDRTPAGRRHKLDYIRKAHRAVATSSVPVRVVAAHRDLLPVVMLLRHLPSFSDAMVIQYGSEVWAGRRSLGQRLVGRADIEVVTISNFTAGALISTTPAQVLIPGLTRRWYDTLVTTKAPPKTGRNLLTAFRLSQWRSKGLDTILGAMDRIGDPDVSLTVCGSGPVPEELSTLIKSRLDCRLLADLSDGELAKQYSAADLFVLATRMAPNAGASGEGFGLVLVEAQLTGTPVIAPAFGGAGDALHQGVTGLVPRDESVEALARQIALLLEDNDLRDAMGAAAKVWAGITFDPDTYTERVVEALLPESER